MGIGNGDAVLVAGLDVVVVVLVAGLDVVAAPDTLMQFSAIVWNWCRRTWVL